jgi:hypothetical protein
MSAYLQNLCGRLIFPAINLHDRRNHSANVPQFRKSADSPERKVAQSRVTRSLVTPGVSRLRLALRNGPAKDSELIAQLNVSSAALMHRAPDPSILGSTILPSLTSLSN